MLNRGSRPAATFGVPEKVGLWDCEDARDGPTVADFDKSLWLPVGADPEPREVDEPDRDGADVQWVERISRQVFAHRQPQVGQLLREPDQLVVLRRLLLRVGGRLPLQGIDYVMPMASAQVKSALLLAGIQASGVTTVTEPAPTTTVRWKA